MSMMANQVATLSLVTEKGKNINKGGLSDVPFDATYYNS